jgi:monoamine oxidase
VLEAREEAGGRVRTLRTPFSGDLYGEAGARRISGAHERVLRLSRELGLTLMPYASPTGSAVVHVKGLTLRAPGELERAAAPLGLRADEAGRSQGELLERYAGEAAAELGPSATSLPLPARWGALDRVTWPDWLRSRGASAGAVTLMTLGGDSRDLSALYVLRLIALLRPSDQFYKIDGGMDRLPRRLAETLGDRVRYGAAVTRVIHGADRMEVEYREGGRASTLWASRVVFTVPFPALRRVEIQPALSAAKSRAIAELPYFPATRFLLQSGRRFWEADDLNGSARTDDPAEIWDGTYEVAGPAGVLGATAGGEIGEDLTRMTDAQALQFGVGLVARTFATLRAEFQQGAVVRWAREPWAHGAFAVFRPGQMTGLLPDILRPEGRVHFAGEHTSPWTGWMEGALESAERVRDEVLA